jgi:hypothetical protein
MFRKEFRVGSGGGNRKRREGRREAISEKRALLEM